MGIDLIKRTPKGVRSRGAWDHSAGTWRYWLCALCVNILLNACASGGSTSGPPSSSPPPPDSAAPPPESSPPPSESSPPPPDSLPGTPPSIPLGKTGDYDLAPVKTTNLRFGAAFGPGPDLGRVLAVDGYGHRYWIDLQDRITAAASTLDLLDWLAPTSGRTGLSSQVTPEFAVDLSLAANALVSSPEYGPYSGDDSAKAFELNASLGDTRLRFLHNWDSQQYVRSKDNTDELLSQLRTTSVFALPYILLVDNADGMKVEQSLHETISLTLGFLSDQLVSSRRTGGNVGGAEIWITEITIEPSSVGQIAIQTGGVLEERRLLGTNGGGALGMPSSSSTLFAGLAGTLHLNDGFEAFGQASLGFTDPDRSSGSLLKNVSRLRSSSFGLGVVHGTLFTPGDRLIAAVSQPLRIESGAAAIDRPVEWTVDGRVLRGQERITLEPEGREINLELGYRLPLGGNTVVDLNWLSQIEPGHRDVSPSHTLAIKLQAEL